MFYCEICGLKIRINNRFQMIQNLSRDYIIPPCPAPDITLGVSNQEIDAERAKYPQFDDGYHEAIVLFRKLSEKCLSFDIFFLHCAAVSLDGKAYLFTGKSGIGKSTHARLWTRVYPRSFIINGDKPLIRLKDGRFYVFGTPWCGKEMQQKNTSAPIKAVCFLEQSDDICVRRMAPLEVIGKIFDQTAYQKDTKRNAQLMALLDKFITDIPFYLLKCDISEKAVLTAHDAMEVTQQ